jgi:hypothetical protein
MRKTFLTTTAAVALLAGMSLASAEGTATPEEKGRPAASGSGSMPSKAGGSTGEGPRGAATTTGSGPVQTPPAASPTPGRGADTAPEDKGRPAGSGPGGSQGAAQPTQPR